LKKQHFPRGSKQVFGHQRGRRNLDEEAPRSAANRKRERRTPAIACDEAPAGPDAPVEQARDAPEQIEATDIVVCRGLGAGRRGSRNCSAMPRNWSAQQL
jgi:hypothetical protein